MSALPAASLGGSRRQRFLVGVAERSLVIAAAVIFLAPFVFIALTSVMTDRQALSPRLWPDPLRISNFTTVFHQVPLLRYAGNTFLYAGLATIGVVLSSVPVAYALARLRWKGREAAFLLVVAAMLLPTQATIIPIYVMFSKLHLVGTLWPLILPNWFGDAFSIFLLRQFFLTIPFEYADAARVDGASELRIMALTARLARPAIAAVALFQLPLLLEGLLRAAPLHRRELLELDALRLVGAVPDALPGPMEPDHGGDPPLHGPGDRPLLLRPEGVRRGRDAHRGEGMKVAVVGAGSTYTPELVSGLAREGETIGLTDLVLHDIDRERREVVGDLGRRMLAAAGYGGRVEVTGSLERALDGADAVLLQIRVGGQAARLRDETLPLPCGCIGQETTGAGGLAKAMRTVPVVLGIAEEVRARAAAGAWIVDFTNPVGIVTRSLLDHGHRAIGLCNVAIGFQRLFARLLGVGPSRVSVNQVGLNHLTWVRGVAVDGQEVLRDLMSEHGAAIAAEIELPLRLLEELGAIPSYYLRYFYAHDAVLAEERSGEPRAARVAAIERELLELYRDPALVTKPALLDERGGAYYSEAATALLRSLVTGDGAEHVVDVRSAGALAGLADDDVVELPARIDTDGPVPLPQDPLPAELLGLIQHTAAYERVAAAAAERRDRPLLRKALLAHPLIGQHERVDALDALGTELFDGLVL